tara:strand:- start:217 stop:360 length:144 start_codon:yes stop_codon:yes gene_type:complete
MSGDYETLEINQPKISYFQEDINEDTERIHELINTIEKLKKKVYEIH